jgi:large subunit ribosomal protein L33
LLHLSKLLASATFSNYQPILVMPREHIILECTEARAEGKPVSRYMSTRDKKQQPDRVEKKKYNKFLRRHTLHREIKG